MRPGDALAVFSDGVLDVHPYLEGDLAAGAATLLADAGSAQEMAERLAAGAPGQVTDDVTVLVLRRRLLPGSQDAGGPRPVHH